MGYTEPVSLADARQRFEQHLVGMRADRQSFRRTLYAPPSRWRVIDPNFGGHRVSHLDPSAMSRSGAPRRQVARLRGALTAASGDCLLHSLRTFSPRPEHVEIDLSAVTSIDRAGANLLLDACVATLLRGGAFALSGPSPTCRRSLERFGVLDVVELVDRRVPSRTPWRRS